MLKVTWLTPEDQIRLDPYGTNYAVVKGRVQCDKRCPAHRNRLFRVMPDEMLERYLKIAANMRCDRHEPYWQYNLDHLSKWGPQGGTVPFSQVDPILTELYENAERISVKPSPVMLRGQEYFLRLLDQLVDKYGKPQHQPIEIYRTQAALPTGGHKGDFDAETQAAAPFRHVWPARFGTRFMRNGPRVIFEDSVLNVRWIQPLLDSVRNWLKTKLPEFFNGWMNPVLHTNRYATDLVRRNGWSVETDYKKMDRHVTFELVQQYIYPIYEHLLDPSDFLKFQRYCEEAFQQPLYMGDFMYTGKHVLFSGQGITNDFETFLTVQNAIGTVLAVLRSLRGVTILANGDDMALLVQRCTAEAAGELMRVFNESAELLGLEMSPEKCGVYRGVVHFCRKVYYPAGRINPDTGDLWGAYPGVLCLNNIVQPEHPYEVVADEIIPTLQRLDGMVGSPEYFLTAQLVQRFSTLPLLTDGTRSNAKYPDWWERLYGERWDPEVSPTLRFLSR